MTQESQKPEITDDFSFARSILRRCERCRPDGTGEVCFWESCFMADLIVEKTSTIEALREAFPEVREWLDKHIVQ